jgi:hypothetical protein
MLGFPLGILSAAGAAVGFESDYELISTTILGGTAASVTFSSLGDYSSIYKHLQIRVVGRTTRTDLNRESIGMRFNGVSTSSYSNHDLFGSGTSVGSSSETSVTRCLVAFFSTNNITANIFDGAVIDILDPYSTTKNKTVRSLAGRVQSGNPAILLASSLFISTASTTSLELFPALSNNFVAGSRFSLYGIKG